MNLIEAQARLLSLKQPLIQTADAAICLNISRIHASKILGRLAKADIIYSVSRGLWSLTKNIDPLSIPEYLTAPFPSYISLQTALYYHGIISQIPSIIYAVSLARTRCYQTPLGTVSIHHLNPDFLFDYSSIANFNSHIKMATPEKALLDILYLTPARSGLFKALPELELPKNFDIRKSFKIINKINSITRRAIVTKRFEDILSSRINS